MLLKNLSVNKSKLRFEQIIFFLLHKKISFLLKFIIFKSFKTTL